MKNNQFLETTATMMTGYESNVLLAISVDGKLDWILDSRIAYHLCKLKKKLSLQINAGRSLLLHLWTKIRKIEAQTKRKERKEKREKQRGSGEGGENWKRKG